jgi:prepilin-type N-terminal cleavage/methylation domain-containing protein
MWELKVATMKRMQKAKFYGFTLVEMLLVMTIVGAMLVASVKYSKQRTMAISVDRTSMQMQQILNAGLSYYVNNGKWPADLTALQPTYIPANMISPYGTAYTVDGTTNPVLFSVQTILPAALAGGSQIAQIIAGKLPYGQTGTASGPVLPPPAPPPTVSAVVRGQVNIPGQNLNNLGNVSFAGIYKNGACVPAPSCPVSPSGAATTPQVFVVPASVSGMNDAASTNSYPLTSFTAFATTLTDVSAGGPPGCNNSTTAPVATTCYKDTWGGTPITTGKYWRVCLAAVTSKGRVVWDATTGQYGTVMVVTRCGINTENTGSSFTVWAN